MNTINALAAIEIKAGYLVKSAKCLGWRIGGKRRRYCIEFVMSDGEIVKVGKYKIRRVAKENARLLWRIERIVKPAGGQP